MRYMYTSLVSGLGNRLSPMISAIRLSRMFNYKPVLLWVPQATLPCEFHDLFENTEWEVSSSYDFVRQVDEGKLPGVYHFKDQDEPGWIGGFAPDYKNRDCLFNTYKLTILDREFVNKTIPWNFMQVPEPARTELISIHHTLRPVAEIRQRLSEIRFEPDVIGVHIRKPEVLRQPGENKEKYWYKDRVLAWWMRERINKNPDQRFFFSCDCKPTENRFRKRFGDRLIIQPNKVRAFEWDYSDEFSWCKHVKTTKQAIIEAYVDMICLSRTCYLLRNLPSTFSSYAGFIGGIQSILP